MARIAADPVRQPIGVALRWAVFYLVLSMLLSVMFFEDFSMTRFLFTIPLAIVGGGVWAFFMRWILRSANDAR